MLGHSLGGFDDCANMRGQVLGGGIFRLMCNDLMRRFLGRVVVQVYIGLWMRLCRHEEQGLLEGDTTNFLKSLFFLLTTSTEVYSRLATSSLFFRFVVIAYDLPLFIYLSIYFFIILILDVQASVP